MTNFKDIRRALENLESGGERDRERVRVPPEQSRRIRRAFAAVDEPIDAERVADLFVYGPSGPDFTDSEAEAVREIAWREEFDGEPPWTGDDP